MRVAGVNRGSDAGPKLASDASMSSIPLSRFPSSSNPMGMTTDVGGELLTIEAAMMPGKGRMTVTGNLRDVELSPNLGDGKGQAAAA